MTIKTYGLAIEKPHAITPLNLAPMSLVDAEKARDQLAQYGKLVHVINLKAV
jgi:hypothetical protein